jgi:RNA polymerase primary sigma factor
MGLQLDTITELSDVSRHGSLEDLTARERAEYREIPPEIRYVDNEAFRLPAAERQFAGPEEAGSALPAWTYPAELADAEFVTAVKTIRLSRDQERQLFLEYNYARYRLAGLVAARRARPSAAAARQMIRWHGRATAVRANIVRANMPLVVAMANRFGTKDVEFAELVGEGNVALLRAVALFDVGRGFKFSTYACRAILQSLSRLASKAVRYRRLFTVEFDPDLEPSDRDAQRHESRRQDALDDVRDVLLRNRAGLRPIERRIVMERFAIASTKKGRTFAQIARRVGLSAERVRQIQARALRKIHTALSDLSASTPI